MIGEESRGAKDQAEKRQNPERHKRGRINGQQYRRDPRETQPRAGDRDDAGRHDESKAAAWQIGGEPNDGALIGTVGAMLG